MWQVKMMTVMILDMLNLDSSELYLHPRMERQKCRASAILNSLSFQEMRKKILLKYWKKGKKFLIGKSNLSGLYKRVFLNLSKTILNMRTWSTIWYCLKQKNQITYLLKFSATTFLSSIVASMFNTQDWSQIKRRLKSHPKRSWTLLCSLSKTRKSLFSRTWTLTLQKPSK